MRNKIIIKSLIFGLLVFGVCLFSQPPKAQALDIGVQGTVTDSATGSPIPDVTVSSVPLLIGTTTSTTTDADGHYNLTLATGLYTINFTPSAATGHTAASSSNLSLLSVTTLNKQLNRPSYTMSGSVKDPSNNVLADTYVALTDYTGTAYESTTDSLGELARSLLAGHYSTFISVPSTTAYPTGAGFTVSSPLNVSSNTSHNYQLPSMSTYSVLAKDASGTPIANRPVVVSVAYPWPGSSGISSGGDLYVPQAQLHQLTTNSFGIASFEAFAGMKASIGSICMSMESIVYTVCNSSEFTFASGTPTATLQEPSMRTISGRITTSTNTGAADVQVSFGNGNYGTTVNTDSQGYYSASVPQGTYDTNFTVWMGNIQIMLNPFSGSINATNNATRDFQLPATTTVNMTVRGTANAIVPNTMVYLSLATRTGSELTSSSDTYNAVATGSLMSDSSGIASFALFQGFQSYGGDMSAYLPDMDATYSNTAAVSLTGNISVHFGP